MLLKLRTVGSKKVNKKRKAADSMMENPERGKKKKSSLPVSNHTKDVSDEQAVKPKFVTATELDDSSESEVDTKPVAEIALLKEGESSPRGEQWRAVGKFCMEMYKLSTSYLEEHVELKKFENHAEMTAKRVKWCNDNCPGPLSTDDEFKTPWGPNDKNRWRMFKFLGKVKKLVNSLSSECLKANDREGLETIRKAEKQLRVVLRADPVLDYIDNKKIDAKKNVVSWAKSETQRIKFIYRLKRWHKRLVDWNLLTSFFANRSRSALRRKFRDLGYKAKVLPLPKVPKVEDSKKLCVDSHKKDETNANDSEQKKVEANQTKSKESEKTPVTDAEDPTEA